MWREYKFEPGRCRAAVLFVVLTCAFTIEASGQTNNALRASDRVYIASRIYALVKLYFAHGHGVHIEEAYQQYVDAIVAAPGRKEFDFATLKFVAALRNGHTHFFDDWLNENYGQPFPFWMDQVEGKWVVTSTRLPALKRGSVVRELDGRPINLVMDEKLQYVGASNERLARSHVLDHPFLFPTSFVLTLEDGTTVRISRQRLSGNAQDQTPDSEGRWVSEGKVAYIRIPSFGDSNYERTALQLAAQYRGATTLIIDVRGNGGGGTPWQFIRALMNRPWRTWSEVTPQHIGLFEAQGQTESMLLTIPSKTIQPNTDAFAGKLIFLVDRYCGSACEDLVMPFKDNGRATIIGETTQGSTGQPYRTLLHDGMTLMIGTLRCTFPDGTEFESVGIEPTISVPTSVKDIMENRDTALEKAIEVAKR